MKTSKKILAALLAVFFILAFSAVPVGADSKREFVIDSVSVSKTGYCEVIGHYSNVDLNTQISCVVAKDALFDGNAVIEENFNTDYVAWIGQEGTGNNGTFLFQFSVPEEFSETTLIVRLTSSYGDIAKTNIDIPALPPGIEVVENNSVIYGRDAFYVPGVFYAPDNIAESIVFGGNNIYFKIGGLWYDLMDDAAVDNSFLVAENATTEKTIVELVPRYYYSMTSKVEFKYFLEEE